MEHTELCCLYVVSYNGGLAGNNFVYIALFLFPLPPTVTLLPKFPMTPKFCCLCVGECGYTRYGCVIHVCGFLTVSGYLIVCLS